MKEFTIPSNRYLKNPAPALWRAPFTGYGKAGNPDYLNNLKNIFRDFPERKLNDAAAEVKDILHLDLPRILRQSGYTHMTLCIVPRSKAEASYHPSQLKFKQTVQAVVRRIRGFEDGSNYLIRHTNTRTTHLKRNTRNFNNDGPDPYPGITAETCMISGEARGKNILLVDDIYTYGVNVDEDAIQALLDAGANSVTLYTVARTEHRNLDADLNLNIDLAHYLDGNWKRDRYWD